MTKIVETPEWTRAMRRELGYDGRSGYGREAVSDGGRGQAPTCAECDRRLRAGAAVLETHGGFVRVAPETPGALHLDCAQARAHARLQGQAMGR